MTGPFEDLTHCQVKLKSKCRHDRDSAAEQLSDYLQYSEPSHESRLAVSDWLLDALWEETDDVVLESILNALGWINSTTSYPNVSWRRLAEYLPKLQSPLLNEYAIATLGECGDASMIPFLEVYRDHADPDVRCEAVKAVESLCSYGQTKETESMESPETWDLLTASLAVSDLSKPESAWAFLVVQGLVRDFPEDRSRFLQLIHREQERGPITGPSLESRVAGRLKTLEIATCAGSISDPNATVAKRRRNIIQSWCRETGA